VAIDVAADATLHARRPHRTRSGRRLQLIDAALEATETFEND